MPAKKISKKQQEEQLRREREEACKHMQSDASLEQALFGMSLAQVIEQRQLEEEASAKLRKDQQSAPLEKQNKPKFILDGQVMGTIKLGGVIGWFPQHKIVNKRKVLIDYEIDNVTTEWNDREGDCFNYVLDPETGDYHAKTK